MAEKYKLSRTELLPYGVSYTDKGIRVSTVMDADSDCGIILFHKDTKEELRISFPAWARQGRICAMEIENINEYNTYLLFEGNEIFSDPYSRDAEGYGLFGEPANIVSKIYKDEYVHKYEYVQIPFFESMFYMLHVRGFTAHNSSKIKAAGTFAGLVSKLDYIKKLGFNSIILMPVYDFNEIISIKSQVEVKDINDMVSNSLLTPGDEVPENIKELGNFSKTAGNAKNLTNVNFWGYADGFYYMPKHTYSYTKDANKEFHELVDEIHKRDMEVILQFVFKPSFSVISIIDVLRFWRIQYRIDGFQLIGTGLPIIDILNDPVLYGCKLLYDDPVDSGTSVVNKMHGQVDFGFMMDARRFLKGDPNMASIMAGRLRDANPKRNPINTIAKQDSMRLYDIVSYNEKHNLDNGENGRDGADINLSWNCGVEGITKKKNIMSLRKKQIKNALTIMMLSQGAPLIFSGDEFGNTQFGNNNPYNQDNATGYIKWPGNKIGKEILDYTAKLIEIRKRNPAFGSDKMLLGRDPLSYGYPDVSMHGANLWRADLGPSSHAFGILYFNKYFDADNEELVYVIYNMYWEEQDIALPVFEKNRKWKICLTSDEKNVLNDEKVIRMEPRSVAIIESYKE